MKGNRLKKRRGVTLFAGLLNKPECLLFGNSSDIGRLVLELNAILLIRNRNKFGAKCGDYGGEKVLDTCMKSAQDKRCLEEGSTYQ